MLEAEQLARSQHVPAGAWLQRYKHASAHDSNDHEAVSHTRCWSRTVSLKTVERVHVRTFAKTNVLSVIRLHRCLAELAEQSSDRGTVKCVL